MGDKKRHLAAPCGLYCGACLIYSANKRKDFETIDQMEKQIAERLDQLEEMGHIPGMPPPAEGCDFSQLKKDVQEGKEYMRCEGCLSEVIALPCRICGFRSCAQKRGLTNCSECPEMPCEWLNSFENDGIPHHAEVIANLKRQKEIGIDAWIVEQEGKWRCDQCGCQLGWYDSVCPDCRATQKQTHGTSPFS